MNWRILSNAVKNCLMIFGVMAVMGWFAGGRMLSDVIGALVLGGGIYSLYWLETKWRELRLARGWYR